MLELRNAMQLLFVNPWRIFPKGQHSMTHVKWREERHW
jgi:hypothetical protein